MRPYVPAWLVEQPGEQGWIEEQVHRDGTLSRSLRPLHKIKAQQSQKRRWLRAALICARKRSSQVIL